LNRNIFSDLVYICHPYRGDEVGNQEKCKEICRLMRRISPSKTPVAPQIFLHHFVDENTEQRVAMRMCIDLLDACSELRVCYFGDHPMITPGMMEEISNAALQGIQVTFLSMDQLKKELEDDDV